MQSRETHHALLTASAGATLAAGAFAMVRSYSRSRLHKVDSLDDLGWICGDDLTAAAARKALDLDSAVRSVQIAEPKSAAQPAPLFRRVPSLHRLTSV